MLQQVGKSNQGTFKSMVVPSSSSWSISVGRCAFSCAVLLGTRLSLPGGAYGTPLSPARFLPASHRSTDCLACAGLYQGYQLRTLGGCWMNCLLDFAGWREVLSCASESMFLSKEQLACTFGIGRCASDTTWCLLCVPRPYDQRLLLEQAYFSDFAVSPILLTFIYHHQRELLHESSQGGPLHGEVLGHCAACG